MKNTRLPMLALFAALISPLAAASQSEVELDYVDVMHGLLDNMQGIIVAIMYEDYETLGDLAENIAYHPGPSSDKRMALVRRLGMEALTFRMFQDRVRQQGLQLMNHARQSDRLQVLRSYSELAQACTDCHSSYRAQVRGMKDEGFSPRLFKN